MNRPSFLVRVLSLPVLQAVLNARFVQQVASARRKGISMIEVLGVLAIAAILIGGGVALFNTATTRAEGSNIAQALQGFMVDMNQYLAQNHNETWSAGVNCVVTEAELQGTRDANATVRGRMQKNFGTGAGGNIESLRGGAAVGAAVDVEGTGCAALGANIANINMLRFTNLQTVRWYESPASSDPDAVKEWTLYIDDQNTFDLAFSLMPQEIVASGAGTGQQNAVASGTALTQANLHQITANSWCPAHDATDLPDTAVVVAIALEDLDVCQQVANRVTNYDHVLDAWCLNEDTDIQAPVEITGTTGTTDGDASLHVCFGVDA